MNHKIECKCGSIKGHIDGVGACCRVVCYCDDCRTFAKFLGHSDELLDMQGGTEVVQLSQSRLVFSQGKEHLAVLKLSEKGLLRWYAKCCKTPIGNTLSNNKVSFIGLVDAFLDQSKIDEDFGKDAAVVNVESAIGEPKPKKKGFVGVILIFLRIFLSARISGSYKKSPLFNEDGGPIATPKVLTLEERNHFKSV